MTGYLNTQYPLRDGVNAGDLGSVDHPIAISRAFTEGALGTRGELRGTMLRIYHRIIARRAYSRRMAEIDSTLAFGTQAYALASIEACEDYELALELAEVA